MKDPVKLPSGKEMVIQLSAWENGRDLYQVILSEAKDVHLDAKTELNDQLWIKLAMKALASKLIEAAIWKCADKVLVDRERLTKDYFEPEDNRQDYLPFLYEVGKANLAPFMKGLYAELLPQFVEQMKSSPT